MVELITWCVPILPRRVEYLETSPTPHLFGYKKRKIIIPGGSEVNKGLKMVEAAA